MPLIALDTETGGFNTGTNPLLSMAMVELDKHMMPTNNRLTLYILPEPGLVVKPDAAAINDYSSEAWAKNGAMPLKEAMAKVAEWLPQDSHALCHNVEFDERFYRDAERRTGIKTRIGPSWICSLVKFRQLDQLLGLGAVNHKLKTLAEMSGYQWGPGGAHQAHEDVLAAAHGYRWLIGKQLVKEAQDRARRQQGRG